MNPHPCPDTVPTPALSSILNGGEGGRRPGEEALRGSVVQGANLVSEEPLTEAIVLDVLRQVLDPEIGMNIVDLGLIYDVKVIGTELRVAMTLTTAGCPMSESIRSGAECALQNLAGVTAAQVELVFDPPWHPGMITHTSQPEHF